MRSFTGNTRTTSVTVFCVAQFVVVLDVTIVATALPDIGRALRFSAGGLGWVITAYTVVLAGLLVVGGRVADVVGSVRTFRVGLAGFAVASAACALAPGPAFLIGARLVQGAAAAALSPAAFTSLTAAVSDSPIGKQAIGWWTAAAAGGGASGWLLGGLIVETLGWRWVFGINVPIALVALVAGRRALRALAGRQVGRARTLDAAGASLLTVAIALTVLGLSVVADQPASATGPMCLLLGAVAALLLWRRESTAHDPLLPARLLRTRGVLGGNLTAIALTASTTPAMLTVVLYAHDQLGLSAVTAAVLFPVFNVAVIAMSLVGPSIQRRSGRRTALVSGFTGIAIGAGLLTALPADGVPVAMLLTSFVLMGAGLGVASVASTTIGTADVTGSRRGVASGLLNSSAQLGSAAGLAVTTPIVAAATSMEGYRVGVVLAAAVAVLGIAVAVADARR